MGDIRPRHSSAGDGLGHGGSQMAHVKRAAESVVRLEPADILAIVEGLIEVVRANAGAEAPQSSRLVLGFPELPPRVIV